MNNLLWIISQQISTWQSYLHYQHYKIYLTDFNAYENAIKVKDSYIKVNVKYNGNMLYIYVSNTFDGKVEEENGNIVSLKGKEHGYGLENINRIAEKYGGNIKIEHSDKRFVVSVIMYIIN